MTILPLLRVSITKYFQKKNVNINYNSVVFLFGDEGLNIDEINMKTANQTKQGIDESGVRSNEELRTLIEFEDPIEMTMRPKKIHGHFISRESPSSNRKTAYFLFLFCHILNKIKLHHTSKKCSECNENRNNKTKANIYCLSEKKHSNTITTNR